MEASLVEGDSIVAKEASSSEDSVSYISQKGGTVLVDKSGEILYKHIEDDKSDSWPDIDEIVKLVEARVCFFIFKTLLTNFSRTPNTWRALIILQYQFRKVEIWQK